LGGTTESFVRASLLLCQGHLKVAATGWALLSDEAGGGQIRLRQFFGIQFALLFLVQPIEFRFHEFHVFLPGDHSFLVRVELSSFRG